jgi:hypothetical protein
MQCQGLTASGLSIVSIVFCLFHAVAVNKIQEILIQPLVDDPECFIRSRKTELAA